LDIPHIRRNTSYCIDINTPSSFAQRCNKKDAGFLISQVDVTTEYHIEITPVNAAGKGKSSSIKLPGKFEP